jgi:cytoskeleton protein RodZ
MAEHLRINRRYIHALEEGRVKDLPGAAYAVGFVRSYAGALGLDPDEAVRRFRDVTGGAATKSGDLVFPEPVPSRGMPAGALVAVGVVIAIGAYVAWYNWTGSGNRTVDAVPPLPPRLEESAQEGTRLRDGVVPPAADVTPTPVPAPVVVAPRPAPVDPNEPRIVIRARGESWIQVRDTRENRVLLDRVLRSGDSWAVPNREGIVLTTGKAENLEMVLDGQPATTTLTGATGVRRGVPMDVDRLRVTAGAGPAGPVRPGQPAASRP